MTKNAIIGFPRYTKDFTFAEDGTAFEADYPVGNLSRLPLSRVARAPGTTLRFTATCATPRLTQLFGFCRHNFSISATMRIELYSDAGMTMQVYDSAADADFDNDVWPIVYPQDARPYIASNWWTGRYASSEIEGYAPTRPVRLPQATVTQGIRVTITDADNEDGYVECGVFEIAQAWELSTNFGFGAGYGFRQRTKVVEADGGVKYRERRDKPRTFNGTINYLNRDETLIRAWEHQRQLDVDTPFLWVPDPGNPMHGLRTAGLFHNTDLGLMRYAAPGRDAVAFAFEEEM